ncbi:MAG: phosphatidate cytidylyltransferase [Anaerolineales bacterium]|nr:phosphatidate cytidylyltransferase [Anaerolineales bacterium]MCX7755287.1 phosphatidate cytidylyltransferase [Anaerolineales bacterium]MDW8278466.1 phosphatidate cytidylyltransferase [Anaerolineales bacterium]
MNSFLALVLTFVIALTWLRIMDFAAHRGWVESRLSRKIIHIGTGPIFVLCWLLFPGAWYDRYLAAFVPGLITIQFALVGLGVIRDEASVKAMSRSGDPREILRGPLYYGIMFVSMTIFFWKDSPIGIVALMMMCGGDGIADLVGRRVASPKWPHSPQKSLAGSLGVFLGGWFLAAFVLWVYGMTGVFSEPFPAYLGTLTVIAAASTLVESLPQRDIDNITVTVTAALMGWWLLG